MKSLWFSKQAVVNKLTKALKENPDCTIDVVLSNPDLVSSVRNEVPELVSYLQKDNFLHLQQLFDLALSDRANNETMDFRFNRNAANVLSFSARTIQKLIQNSPVFIPSFTQFMQDKKYSRDPVYAGHFQRIIQSFLYASSGNVINTIPNLTEFLLSNLDILSYKMLVASFISDFSDFVKDTSLISEIAEIANSDNSPSNLFAVTLMIDVLQATSEFSLFYDKAILENLIEKASMITDPNGNLLYFEIFHLLSLILVKYDAYITSQNNEANPELADSPPKHKQREQWFNDLNKQYISKFLMDPAEPNERTFAAFPFFSDFLFSSYSSKSPEFSKFLDNMVPLFFNENAPCNFTRSFISHVKLMKDDSLILLIQNNNILQLIIDAGLKMPYENPTKFIIGHVFELAIEIFSKSLYMPGAKKSEFLSVGSDEWNKFLVSEILPRNDLINGFKALNNDRDSDDE